MAAPPHRAALLAVLARLAGAKSLAAFQQAWDAETLLDPGPNLGEVRLAAALAAAPSNPLRLCLP